MNFAGRSWVLLMAAVLPVGAQVVTYDVPRGVAPSVDFAASASGHPIHVYMAATLHPGDIASFAGFDFAGTADITIESKRDVQSVRVLPSSAGITPVMNGREIHFTLARPGNLTVEINGSWEHALHLFANPLETDRPRNGDPHVLYFGTGIHNISTLQLHSGDTLYLAGGAILRAVLPPAERPTVARDWAGQRNYQPFLRAVDVSHVRICGRGIIDLSGLPWHARTTFQLGRDDDVTIEGITFIGSSAWTVAMFESKNIHVRNIKEICARENSDGIDICNSQDVTVDDCFLRNDDDEICVKTVESFPAPVSANITVQHCVIWNERARALGITNETRRDIHDVLFRDCDIIHDFSTADDCAPLAVIISDSGTISHIRFQDIRLEDVAAKLVLCRIAADQWGHDSQRGHLNDVVFQNITVGSATFPTSELTGFDDDHLIENVSFNHLVIQGQVIGSAGQGRISVNPFVNNVQFSADGRDDLKPNK